MTTALRLESRLKIPDSLVVKTVDSKDSSRIGFRSMYSRMKYGDPMAVRKFSELIANAIYSQLFATGIISFSEQVVLTSSAFGAVPTASHVVMKSVIHLLQRRGIRIDEIKIDRNGDFETTNYGSMDLFERQQRMLGRNISMSDQAREMVKGKVAIVIDDVSVTGSHERTLRELLSTTEAKAVVFTYLLAFSKELANKEPQVEEYYNHAAVKTVADLEPWFKNLERNNMRLTVNARTIKFILSTEDDQNSSKVEKLSRLKAFLSKLDDSVISKLYAAATSSDGYCHKAKFVDGFYVLGDLAVSRRLVRIEDYHRVKSNTVLFCLTVDASGNLIDMVTGEQVNHVGERYSRMKFGSVPDLDWFGIRMAKKFIARLEDPTDNLRQAFMQIKERGEHIALVSPGSRNVESAQNFIFEVAVRHINIWLARHDLPTLVLVKLTRFGSGTANYAQLSAEARMKEKRESNITKSVLPGSDFFDCGLHLFFADDARITGASADRVEIVSQERGALSFRAIYCVVVDPLHTSANPAVEHFLNSFVIKGGLDANVVEILNHPQYRPVQRMIRLLLGANNRLLLKEFLLNHIRQESLIKIYESCLGNDYFLDERYAESINILIQVLESKNLIDSTGCLQDTANLSSLNAIHVIQKEGDYGYVH